MTFVRVLGSVGRFFIALGVLTLLFAGYQIWGTNILEARAQGQLEDDYESLLAEIEAEAEAVAVSVEAPADASGDGAADETAPPAEAEEASIFALKPDLLWQENGEVSGLISIPKIGLAKHFVSGTSVDDLQKGPGHYPFTPLPGMPGNASIAGHRTTYGAPFNRIDELEPGDIIETVTPQGVFEYRVIEQPSGLGHFIVSPDRVDVLDQDFAEHPNRLTLTACHPKYSARQRIIVVAELVSEPADYIARPGGDAGEVALPGEATGADADQTGTDDAATELPGDPPPADTETDPGSAGTDDATDGPADDAADDDAADGAGAAATAGGTGPGAGSGAADPDAQPAGFEPDLVAEADFGEGLEGDTSAIAPAVLWGLATLAIWAAAAFLGRRWRKAPAYLLAAAPFALTLFVCYVYIDRAISGSIPVY